MAGSPKAGFPARRPGRLFGKKQMVMFGCIVLVLFVAPSLFGIGDTTDSHGLDPDDRGLVRTDFVGDRTHRRRSSRRADAFDDDAGYRMRDADDLHSGHHGLGSSTWSSSWSSSFSSSSSSRDRHERERDERHKRRARERRRHAGHGGLEHDIAKRASELAIPRVEEYVNRKLVDPAVRAIERGDSVDPNDPSKGHKHGGVGGFSTQSRTRSASAPRRLRRRRRRDRSQRVRSRRGLWPAAPRQATPSPEDTRVGRAAGADGDDDFNDVRKDPIADRTQGAFDDDDDTDDDDARSLRREEQIGFHDFVPNDEDGAEAGSGSKSGSWLVPLRLIGGEERDNCWAPGTGGVE